MRGMALDIAVNAAEGIWDKSESLVWQTYSYASATVDRQPRKSHRNVLRPSSSRNTSQPGC
jgi:hypothetical protein